MLYARSRLTAALPYLMGLILIGEYWCTLTATAGFGIYGYGAWRIWRVVAGSALGLLFVTVALLGHGAFKIPWSGFLALIGALFVFRWNEGWVPQGVPAETPNVVLPLAVMVVIIYWELSLLKPRLAKFMPMLLLGLGAWGYWVFVIIDSVKVPFVDVWYQLNRGAELFLVGESPYATFFPDFYKGEAWFGFDAPGFSYPPAVLFTSVLAKALNVDVRTVLSSLVAFSAIILARIARRSGWSSAASSILALSYIFVPRFGFVIVSGHSEPISGFLLALGAFFIQRGRFKTGFFLYGMFVTSKQYLIVALPMLAMTTGSLLELFLLGAGAVILWLPWIFTEPVALWKAVFQVHVDRPARKDALTLSAWRINHQLRPLRRWIPLAMGAGMGILSSLRFRAPRRLPLHLGICLLPMMVVSPQAFGNYYTLICWCFLLGFASEPVSGMPLTDETWVWGKFRDILARGSARTLDSACHDDD